MLASTSVFQHISAPLMEFERQKLIKRFKREPEVVAVEDKDQEAEDKPGKKAAKGDGEGEGEASMAIIDYK